MYKISCVELFMFDVFANSSLNVINIQRIQNGGHQVDRYLVYCNIRAVEIKIIKLVKGYRYLINYFR